jgi:hypothetical protein
LRVTDYKHIDFVENSDKYKKGFIAQEVEKVYPEAVSMGKEFIPNIYGGPIAYNENKMNKTVEMVMPYAVKDLANGDKVKFITAQGDVYKIIDSISGRKFVIKDWDITDAKFIFVYGKEVNDFRRVDYDRIHTLGISAIQELSKQIELLNALNSKLNTKLNQTQQELELLHSKVEEVYKDNNLLKTMLSSTSER